MHPDALRTITTLGLRPHPEGGFYRETFRAARVVAGAHGPRAAATLIYYLLPAGKCSAFHRVAADEVWHWYDGDPLLLHTIDEDGQLTTIRLGRDLEAGEQPHAVVPAGRLQAAVPAGERYALCGCTVSPGFDFADFELPSRADLLARHPAHAALIESLTA